MKPKLLPKSWILLTYLLLSALPCLADIFVVTSNAATGAGTLHEAIQLANANGTAVTDSIHFNIADQSRAGRSITITSSLPDLSSNLVIDGTTQPGLPFGMSDAKVIILVTIIPNPSFSILNLIAVRNVEIFGLFLFHEKFTMFSNPPASVTGITIAECADITIGKPGKGNYYRGLATGIYSRPKDPYGNGPAKFHCTNLTIQSNIFNNDEEGYATSVYNNSNLPINAMEHALMVSNISNLKIGGPTKIEGNSFNTYAIRIYTSFVNGNGLLLFQNNKVNADVWGNFSKLASTPRGRIYIKGNGDYAHSDYEVKILNNIINDAFEIMHISRFITVQGNKIAEVKDPGNSYFMDLKAGIYLCSGGGIIGGELPEEQNEIYTTNTISSHRPWDNLEDGGIVVAASPNILIRKNKTYCTSRYGTGIKVYNSDQPYIQIDSTAINFVKGKATPNTRIEVFLDDDCWSCDGIAYLGQTTANADSSWSFSGSFTGTVIATATKNDKSTSGYTEPTYLLNDVKAQHPTCGETNGSISGIKLLGSFNNVEWRMTFFRDGSYIDTLISKELDLKNVGPGTYYFVAKLGETCRSAAYFYQLKTYTPSLDESNLNFTNPTCGLFNGRIQGIKLIESNSAKYHWIDESRLHYPAKLLGNDMVSAENLPPGKYKLILRDTIGNCGDSTEWITLTNQSGPTLNLNSIQLTDATCGKNNGSITGISSSGNISGTPYIAWVDSMNNIIANTYDISNLTAGRYRFKFKDQGACDTIITTFYTISNRGDIAIDTSQLKTTTSQCSYASGTIKGIAVTNATSFEWVNASGQIVSASLDPGFLFTGKYVLIARNTFGCEKRTDSITIATYQYMPFTYNLRAEVRPAQCNQVNGYVRFLNFANPQDYTFRWVDSAQPSITIATTLNLTDIQHGTFILFAKNTSGCEQQVAKARLPYVPGPQINEGNLKITDEICNNSLGRIDGLTTTTAINTGPITLRWIDQNNVTVGAQLNLVGVAAGTYRLIIVDAVGCTDTSSAFVINNRIAALNKPVYPDQMIPINNPATLAVQNTQQGTYFLFDNIQSTVPIDQNTTGVFTTNVLTQSKTYFVELVNGVCKSERVPIKITVYDKTVIYVPTAFTPNGDGLNDEFKPIPLGPVKLEFFHIYNRWGELVFGATDFSKGWDGKVKGQTQPQSKFTWTLKAKDEVTGETITLSGSFLLLR